MNLIKKKIRVAAAVTRHEGKILIAQRMKEELWADYWEFPGGKIKEGEAEEACVRRELKEELNIDVEVNEKVWHTEYEYPEKIIELHFYFCRWLGGVVQALECQNFKWVLPEELKQYRFLPANIPLIKRLSSDE